MTEETLLRMHMKLAGNTEAEDAWEALVSIHSHPLHEFWPDNFSHTEVDPTRLSGPAQVTDAWLAELACRKGGQLATLDEALSVLRPESTRLVPV